MRDFEQNDGGFWSPVAVVDKYEEDACQWVRRELDWAPDARVEAAVLESFGIKPYESLESVGNALLNNGINRLLNLLIGTGSIVGYTINNGAGTSRLGVGNGVTAVAASDTDLSAAAGSANRWFQISDAAYPTVSAQTLTMKSTFATGDGNFAWQEWGIDGGGATSANTVGTNTASLAALLNRKIASLGTKVSGSWALTVTITVS